MSNNNSSGGGGMGLACVLGVVFIVLKLCDVIAWSWVWVLSPFWIGLTLLFLVLFILRLLLD
jgi:hypothetical protein